jgi:small neutral amino acid transporter SnatA (MarC family)
MATAVFDYGKGTVTVWSLTNPASSQPVAVLLLPGYDSEDHATFWKALVIVFGVLAIVLLVVAAWTIAVMCNRRLSDHRKPLIQ